jgi:hypothetical protein
MPHAELSELAEFSVIPVVGLYDDVGDELQRVFRIGRLGGVQLEAMERLAILLAIGGRSSGGWRTGRSSP